MWVFKKRTLDVWALLKSTHVLFSLLSKKSKGNTLFLIWQYDKYNLCSRIIKKNCIHNTKKNTPNVMYGIVYSLSKRVHYWVVSQ